MNSVHNPRPDPTRELMRLWPLVHLVVELAGRHGAAMSRPAADAETWHPTDERSPSSDHAEQGQHGPDREVSNG